MEDVVVRILTRDSSGKVEDWQQDFGLEDFAGFLPSVGDIIVDPGVLQGLDRNKPENRDVWTVVGRVFNPRDLKNYVSLIVEERKGTAEDAWL